MTAGRVTAHLVHARALLAARTPASPAERRLIALASAHLDLAIAAARRLHRHGG